MTEPSARLLDELTKVVERTLPMRSEVGSIELHPIDLSAQTTKLLPVGPLVVSEDGILLGVRQQLVGREPRDASAPIVLEQHYDDPRVLAHVEGWLGALGEALREGDAEQLRKSWYRLTVSPSLALEVLELGASAAEYRAKALEFPWLGRLSRALPKRPPAYERAPRELVLRGDRVEFSRIADWIYAFSEQTFADARWDDAMVRALPEPARVLDGVSTINAMVGGNGFEVFLAQTRGATIRQCYAALGKVGAPRLRAVMAKGIALAARQGAEFMYERSTAWIERFASSARDWSELDGWDEGHTYWLIENELMAAADEYANRHRAALVRD
ncbi:MAG: hypothetical protein U0269_18985 [Polyangiales bacterium]